MHDTNLKSDLNNISTIKLIKSYWEQLNKKRKSQLKLLSFIMLLSGFFEMLSIGTVLPFLSALTNDNLLLKNVFLRNIFFTFGLTEKEELLIAVILAFVTTIIFSTFLRIFNIWYTGRIGAYVGNDFACKAYGKTLYQPYSYHLKTNSNNLLASLTIQVNTAVATLQSILNLISSLIILICILIALFIIEWKIASSVLFILCLTYGFLKNYSNNKLDKNSRIIDTKTKEQVKLINEGFGSIKDILLQNSQKIYIDIFSKRDYPLRLLGANNVLLADSPRFLIEAIGILLISIIAFVIVQINSDSGKVIPILGAIILGIQRLLPTSQNIFSSWALLKGNKASLISVLNLIQQKIYFIQKSKTADFSFQRYIEFKNVFFRYSNENNYVINNLSFIINKGERVGFVGTTGSGKSTTIDLIMSLLLPNKGIIKVDDIPLDEKNNFEFLIKWRRNISHVPQNIFLSDNTIKENIAFGIPKDKINLKQVEKSAEKAKISEFINTLPKKYETIVGERGVRFSGGQIQRIAIARAIYKNSKVLVFDEATSALDNKTEKEIIKQIDQLDDDLTIIIIAHRLSTVLNCSKVFELENGKLVNVYSGDQLKQRFI